MKGDMLMARPPKWHEIPETSRVCTTLDSQQIKDIRKLSIDLECPENDVIKLAVQIILNKYRSGGVDAVMSLKE